MIRGTFRLGSIKKLAAGQMTKLQSVKLVICPEFLLCRQECACQSSLVRLSWSKRSIRWSGFLRDADRIIPNITTIFFIFNTNDPNSSSRDKKDRILILSLTNFQRFLRLASRPNLLYILSNDINDDGKIISNRVESVHWTISFT